MAQGVREVSSNRGQCVCLVGGEGDQRVIDDGGEEGIWVSGFEVTKDEGQGDYEKKGAAWVALSNTLPEDVLDSIIHAKRGCRICREINGGGFVKEEAKPSSEKRAIQELNSTPDVGPFHIIESFLKISGEDSEASVSGKLGKFDEFFGATRHTDAKGERGDEAECLCTRHSVEDNHVGSNPDQGFCDAKVSQFDIKGVWCFGEKRTFEACSPWSEPCQ